LSDRVTAELPDLEALDRQNFDSQANPVERLGQVEDIAPVVSFLAGDQGGWINGQVVRVNAGFA
jgi:NAD(P)-dependent dehydrogenase (short-subunit alcohol dehydrogenase family)